MAGSLMLRGAWLAAVAAAGLAAAFPGVAAEPAPGPARVLRVCPVACEFAVPSAAAAVARDGDTVEIQAGDYRGDVAVWRQNGVTIRGVGGRPRLLADGRAAEGKAIWVIKGADVVVENVEFVGTRVPSRNGAGIRAEGRGLTVRDCAFFDNEMGLLTNNDPQNSLVVERSEFGRNGVRDGSHHHGLYAGRIGSLTVRFSYFHQGLEGHLLKSRARVNDIRYNRLVDGEGGQASYELEFPEGGDAVVVGNVIEQSATSPNAAMLSYAAEAKGVATGRLLVAYNTFVTRRLPATFIANHSAVTGVAAFNVFVGAPEPVTAGPVEMVANGTVAELGRLGGATPDREGGDYCVAGLPALAVADVERARGLLAGVSAEMEPTEILGGRPRAAGLSAIAGAVTSCAGEAR